MLVLHIDWSNSTEIWRSRTRYILCCNKNSEYSFFFFYSFQRKYENNLSDFHGLVTMYQTGCYSGNNGPIAFLIKGVNKIVALMAIFLRVGVLRKYQQFPCLSIFHDQSCLAWIISKYCVGLPKKASAAW